VSSRTSLRINTRRMLFLTQVVHRNISQEKSFNVVHPSPADAEPLLALQKIILHFALETGSYEEAHKLIEVNREDFLLQSFANYGGCLCPTYKSGLHLIAALKDDMLATRLCQELLSKIKDTEHRECLINAMVVEEFPHGMQIIHAHVSAIHIAAYNGISSGLAVCMKSGIISLPVA